MLRHAYGVRKVVVAAGRTDMRLGLDGLASLVRLHYRMDPMEEGTLYLFCGRKRDRIKGLYYDEDGFCMLTKRLTQGVYQWPRNTEEALTLDMETFQRLMDGFSIVPTIPKAHKKGPGAATTPN